MNILIMLEDICILRKKNFSSFVRTAKELEYDVNSITLMPPTPAEYDSIEQRIHESYQAAIRAHYGLPIMEFGVFDGLELTRYSKFYVDVDEVNFENLEAAHRKKILKRFRLRKFILKPSDCKILPGPIQDIGISLIGDSLASKNVKRACYLGYLHDESKPQDYKVTIREQWLALQPNLRRLFEEIPETGRLKTPKRSLQKQPTLIQPTPTV